MPEELYDEASVRVEFIMDDQVVNVQFYSGDDVSASYNFEGVVGSAATVYAKFNGIASASQVISF